MPAERRLRREARTAIKCAIDPELAAAEVVVVVAAQHQLNHRTAQEQQKKGQNTPIHGSRGIW
jgi:hypothetical protein